MSVCSNIRSVRVDSLKVELQTEEAHLLLPDFAFVRVNANVYLEQQQ